LSEIRTDETIQIDHVSYITRIEPVHIWSIILDENPFYATGYWEFKIAGVNLN